MSAFAHHKMWQLELNQLHESQLEAPTLKIFQTTRSYEPLPNLYQTSLKPIAMGLSKMGVLSEPIAMGLSKMGVLSECSYLPLWQFTCPLHAQTILRYRLRQCSDSSTQQAASIVMHQIMQQQQRVSAFICTTFQRRCHWGDHTYTSARLSCWNIS